MTVSTQPVQEIMRARKTVRKYEEGKSIPQEVIADILQNAVTAPSSSNLQPFPCYSRPRSKKRTSCNIL